MDFLELRVHGVHGTSPGAMLGVADGEVGQVAGDRLTGVYRTTGDVPLRTQEIPGEAQTPAHTVAVEAYSWGALTSGVKGVLGWLSRLGWLLLLPFALANLAYWARLEVGNTGWRAIWGVRVVRLSSLALTVFMVLMPCMIGVDLLGWQCFRGGVPQCAHVPGALDFIAELTPTQRLFVTSLIPLAVVLLLGFLSRQTMTAYEQVRPDYAKGDAVKLTETSGPVPVLRRRYLWSAAARTRRLQSLHLAAGISTVIVFVDAQVLVRTWDGDRITLIPLVIGGLVIACSAVLVCLEHDQDLETGDGPRSANALRHGAAASVLVGVAAVAFALQGVRLWRYHGEFSETGTYSGNNVWFITLFLVLTVLHLSVFFLERLAFTAATLKVVVVAVIVSGIAGWWVATQYDVVAGALVVAGIWFCVLLRWHSLQPGDNGKAWRGAGPSVLLAAAAWIGLLFTSSAVIGAADLFNGNDRSVGDLTTSVATTPAAEQDEYAASGRVVIHKARYAVEGQRLVLYSGRVSADHFTQGSGTDEIGRTRITGGRATLELPVPGLSYERSCAIEPGRPQRPCLVGSSAFRNRGDLGLIDTEATLIPRSTEIGKRGRITLDPRDEFVTTIVVPQVLVWTPLAQVLWLLLVIVGLGACVFRFARNAGRDVAAGLPDDEQIAEPDSRIPRRDRGACRTRRVRAAFSHRAETLLDVIGTITGPIALALILFSFTGQAPWELWPKTRSIADFAMYVTMLAAAGLVLLGSHLRRSESTRKAVGVIWDLTTFWPRAAHPLAPPCYAERVVPELDLRTRWALNAHPRNQVVLSGHSQGSLIVASMASRLDDASLGRIRMLTYGSQIRALYGRVFPAVFGPDAIGYFPSAGPARLDEGFPDVGYGTELPDYTPDPGSLRARLETAGSTWVNLFRRSDPLGFRVFSDNDSRLDVPVPEVPPVAAGDPGPVVRTHSGYQHTPEYRDLVCSWAGEVRYEDVVDPEDVGYVPVIPRS